MNSHTTETAQISSDTKKEEPVEVRAISFDGILSSEDVELVSSYSRTTIWREERAGRFPKRVQLSPGRVGWIGAEVLEWIRSRPRVNLAECETESGETT